MEVYPCPTPKISPSHATLSASSNITLNLKNKNKTHTQKPSSSFHFVFYQRHFFNTVLLYKISHKKILHVFFHKNRNRKMNRSRPFFFLIALFLFSQELIFTSLDAVGLTQKHVVHLHRSTHTESQWMFLQETNKAHFTASYNTQWHSELSEAVLVIYN